MISQLLQQLEDEIVDRQLWLEENNSGNDMRVADEIDGLEDCLQMLEVIARLTGTRRE